MKKPLPIDEIAKGPRKDIIIAVGGAGANIIKTIYDHTNPEFHKKTRFAVIGYNPEMLAEFAEEDFELYWLERDTEDHDMALFIGTEKTILIGGLGGRTVNYLLPYTIDVAHDFGHQDIKAIVTLPFLFEGEEKRKEAEQVLLQIQEKIGAENVIVVDNELFVKNHFDLTFVEAFKLIDKEVSDMVNSIL